MRVEWETPPLLLAGGSSARFLEYNMASVVKIVNILTLDLAM
jgi:hypothetical protein